MGGRYYTRAAKLGGLVEIAAGHHDEARRGGCERQCPADITGLNRADYLTHHYSAQRQNAIRRPVRLSQLMVSFGNVGGGDIVGLLVALPIIFAIIVVLALAAFYVWLWRGG